MILFFFFFFFSFHVQQRNETEKIAATVCTCLVNCLKFEMGNFGEIKHEIRKKKASNTTMLSATPAHKHKTYAVTTKKFTESGEEKKTS